MSEDNKKNKDKVVVKKNVPIADIKPYEKNYQKHDVNLEHIKNSIKDFDFDVPIVVDVNNVIVKGHGRYEALKELGKDTIPLVAINMALDTKKKASAARIADNESSKAAVVDNDILKFEIDLIGEDFDLGDYGLDLGSLDNIGLTPEELDNFFEESNALPEEEKQKIILEYSEEQYEKVTEAFKNYGAKSREQIVWELLEIDL
jgi:site-specific DNA-methyltransferase (adenine-specific)